MTPAESENTDGILSRKVKSVYEDSVEQQNSTEANRANRYLLYACLPDRKALELPEPMKIAYGKHGLFTAALIRVLQGRQFKNDFLFDQDLANNVHQEMKSIANDEEMKSIANDKDRQELDLLHPQFSGNQPYPALVRGKSDYYCSRTVRIPTYPIITVENIEVKLGESGVGLELFETLGLYSVFLDKCKVKIDLPQRCADDERIFPDPLFDVRCSSPCVLRLPNDGVKWIEDIKNYFVPHQSNSQRREEFYEEKATQNDALCEYVELIEELRIFQEELKKRVESKQLLFYGTSAIIKVLCDSLPVNVN